MIIVNSYKNQSIFYDFLTVQYHRDMWTNQRLRNLRLSLGLNCVIDIDDIRTASRHKISHFNNLENTKIEEIKT